MRLLSRSGTATRTTAAFGLALPFLIGGASPAAGINSAPGEVLVAQGDVSDASGRPTAGTKVTLYAWPSAEELANQKVGDTLNMIPVAVTATDRSGGYSLSVKDLKALSRAADEQGLVNFEVVSRSADGPATWTFGKRLENPGTDRARLTQVQEADDAEVDRGAPRFKDAKPEKTKLKSKGGGRDEAAPEAVEPPPPVDKYCSQKLVQDLGKRKTVVGMTASATTGVAHELNLTTGGSTTPGVGYSTSGSYGSFYQQGTVTHSMNVSIKFPYAANNTGRYYQSEWVYGKYEFLCSHSDGSSEHYFKVLPRSFAASSLYFDSTIPAAPYCGTQTAGSVSSVEPSVAITWSSGAS